MKNESEVAGQNEERNKENKPVKMGRGIKNKCCLQELAMPGKAQRIINTITYYVTFVTDTERIRHQNDEGR